jgi:hypothetical protein
MKAMWTKYMHDVFARGVGIPTLNSLRPPQKALSFNKLLNIWCYKEDCLIVKGLFR